jgi:hypothetical protein
VEDSTVTFYDGLSGDYHLLFEGWRQGVRWQGGVLDRLLRDDLAAAVRQAGPGEIRWHTPEESGYYQPVVTARRP